MKTQKHPIKSFAAPVLLAAMLGAGAGSAAEQPVPPVAPVPPAPWHVPDAEIRIPVTVAVKDALVRMPPQVYLADLQPLATTEGLAFDPKNKAAILHDLRKPEEKAKTIAQQQELYKQQGREWDPKFYFNVGEGEGGPILRAPGSATYAIKPEYQWFSWRARHAPHKVFIDGEEVPEEKIHRWDREKNHGHDEVASARLVAIPPGAKTLRIESGGQRLYQAGFLTRSPAVAHAILCLSGRDPSGLIPIVHRCSGGQVGCRVVWAEARKPMSILFDCSSGDAEYLVYLVDRARNPQRLDWVPEAELVEELRHLEHYDPALETLDGFQRVWDGAAVVGKGVPAEENWPGVGLAGENNWIRWAFGKDVPAEQRWPKRQSVLLPSAVAGEGLPAQQRWATVHPKPTRVIYRGDLPFGSTDAGRLDYFQLHDSRLSGQQEQGMLLRRVKLSIGAGQMDGAREAYQKLKDIAPASPATAEAREAIIQAVRGKETE